MTRTQWGLLGLFVLQLLLLTLLSPWSAVSDAGEAQPLLPALADTEPVKLEITRRAEDAEEERVTIEKTADGWTLPELDGYPADGEKIADLVADLRDVEVRRAVVSSARYHGAMKVTDDEHERHLRAWDADGKEIADLYLGTSPNYQVSHVRRAGEDRVFEARGVSQWDMRTDAASWVNKDLIDVPFDEVVSLQLDNEQGTLRLERDLRREGEGEGEEPGAWRLASDAAFPLDETKVDSFVRSMASLRLLEPAGPADAASLGLDDPVATVELTHGDETVRLRIGAELPAEDDVDAGKRYAALEGSSFAVVLSKWDAEKITGQSAADLASADDAS